MLDATNKTLMSQLVSGGLYDDTTSWFKKVNREATSDTMDYTLYKCKKQIFCLKLQISGGKKIIFIQLLNLKSCLITCMYVHIHTYTCIFIFILSDPLQCLFFVVVGFFYFGRANIFLFFIFVCHVVPVMNALAF